MLALSIDRLFHFGTTRTDPYESEQNLSRSGSLITEVGKFDIIVQYLPSEVFGPPV